MNPTRARRDLLDALIVERYGRTPSPAARLADASAEAPEALERSEGLATSAQPSDTTGGSAA